MSGGFALHACIVLFCVMEDRLVMLQSADWVVFNTKQQLELMRVTCGGWRRPFTFHCTSPSNLTFAHHQPRTSSTHVHNRGSSTATVDPTPPQGPPEGSAVMPNAHSNNSVGTGTTRAMEEGASTASGPQTGSAGGLLGASETAIDAEGEPLTSLHAVHHGREVLCCALLPPMQLQHTNQTDPSSADPPLGSAHVADCSEHAQAASSSRDSSPLCLLTGSEDGTMRHLLYNLPCPSLPQLDMDSPHQLLDVARQDRSAPGGRTVGKQPTIGHQKQNQAADGQQSSKAQQGRAIGGQQVLSEGQAADRQQGGSQRQAQAANGRLSGLYGGNEVGFQAAGSAVKSILAIPLGAGAIPACIVACSMELAIETCNTRTSYHYSQHNNCWKYMHTRPAKAEVLPTLESLALLMTCGQQVI